MPEMATGKLRSSGTLIAPHRAETQWSPQGEIASPRRCVGKWMSPLPRASKMSDNNTRHRTIRIIGNLYSGNHIFHHPKKWLNLKQLTYACPIIISAVALPITKIIIIFESGYKPIIPWATYHHYTMSYSRHITASPSSRTHIARPYIELSPLK